MAIINERRDIGAGVTEPNVLAGHIFQMLRAQSTVRLGIVKEFGNLDNITCLFTIGDSIVAPSIQVKAESQAVGRGVNVNEDLNIVDVGMPADLLGLAITNPGAAAVPVEWYILIA